MLACVLLLFSTLATLPSSASGKKFLRKVVPQTAATRQGHGSIPGDDHSSSDGLSTDEMRAIQTLNEWSNVVMTEEFDNIMEEEERTAGKMIAVPPPMPNEEGCFVWAPSGCQKKRNISVAKKWVRDEVGEARFGASKNRTACEDWRLDGWNRYCGVKDVQVRFSVKPPEAPRTAGCYVWVPQGCTKRPWFKARNWTHDIFGEAKMFAGERRATCEQWRLKQWSHYCGVPDVRMHFVPPEEESPPREAPPAPAEPGCYVWTPAGCPRKPRFGLSSSYGWQHDAAGETHMDALIDEDVCRVSRAHNYSQWCGGVEVQTVFVPNIVHHWTKVIHEDEFNDALHQQRHLPPMPQLAGCYVFSPTACPNKQDAAISKGWVRDRKGEAEFGAASNRTACETLRKRSWSRFCGAADLEVRMIMKAPATPKEPGCYVWAPSGCEKQTWFTARAWTHDKFGESRMFAGWNRTICEDWRLRQWRQYCGVTDLHVRFVPNELGEQQQLLGRWPPPTPIQPGCYVWAPLGCPRRPAFGLASSIAWQHDSHGEMHLNASINKSVCVVSRAKSYLEWCGGTEVRMAFVARPDTPGDAAKEKSAVSAVAEWAIYVASEQFHRDANSTRVQALARLRNDTMPTSERAAPSSSLPTAPGCYVWASQGCPHKPTGLVAQGWMRDVAGEEKFGARTNKTACQSRKVGWMAFCGAKDVEVQWVTETVEAPEAPADPGCYVWAPSGCPNQEWFEATNWTHDAFGEQKMFAAENRTICERWRLLQWKQFCGVHDLQMYFVPATGEQATERQPPKSPRQAGCYIWTPSGCPRKPQLGLNTSLAWLRNVLGEAAGENETLGVNESAEQEVCEVTRARNYSRWCGGIDVKMLYVAPSNASNETEEEEREEEDGEPIRKGQLFLGDDIRANEGDTEAEAGAANAAGRAEVQQRTSVEEVEIDDDGRPVTQPSSAESSEANDNAPPVPTEPGCFIFAPEGCTKRPWFRTKTWVHDVFGESSLNAGTDRQQCEVTRRQQFRRYCGTDSMLTHFVPHVQSE